MVRLKELAEAIKAKIEAQHQASLFPPETVAKQVLEAKTAKAQSSQAAKAALTVDLKQMAEEQRVVLGIHEVYGEVYRQLSFDTLFATEAVSYLQRSTVPLCNGTDDQSKEELKLIISLHHQCKLYKNLTIQFRATEYQLTGYGIVMSLDRLLPRSELVKILPQLMARFILRYH